MKDILSRPMRDMLESASARTSLHMPAAQGIAPYDEISAHRLDTTELAITDDLYQPAGAIARAQALAAKSAGAAHTLLLPGGSTAGIQAMLLYALRQGEQVILPRNVHISVLNACAVAGLEPVFAKISFTACGRTYTRQQDFEKAMADHPNAKAVLALRPDYYGLMPDIAVISQMAHQRNMLMLCDEAHGATFNWRTDVPNAGACGADLFVQSAHKTLPALTPGAWLHAARGVDIERLRRILRMVQTSSPSFLIMRSLDDARAWMDENGATAAEQLAKALDAFHESAAHLGYSSGQSNVPEGHSYDSLRLVLRAPQGGYALDSALREQGMDVEMADDAHIVCILSLMDGEKRLQVLLDALKAIAVQPKESFSAPRRSVFPMLQGIPPRKLPLHEAAFAPCEAVPMAQAAGRICAAHVGLYPPGVALCVAGEGYTQELLAFLREREEGLFGLPSPGKVLCVIPERTNVD